MCKIIINNYLKVVKMDIFLDSAIVAIDGTVIVIILVSAGVLVTRKNVCKI